MKYNRCGKSGLLLPAVSLGLWHNFGDDAEHNQNGPVQNCFDLGITHFDLANNYGHRRVPPRRIRKILRGTLRRTAMK